MESGLAAASLERLPSAFEMARHLFNQSKLVREITVARSFEEAEFQDQKSWRAMSPRRRLAAVELWRQMNHRNYDPATARLPRLFEVVEPVSR